MKINFVEQNKKKKQTLIGQKQFVDLLTSNPVVFGILNAMLQKRVKLNPTAQQNRLKQ